MKKTNIIKRNSGFVVGCVLAAGASFFAGDVLTSDQLLLKSPVDGTVQSETANLPEEEPTEAKTYETNPFTVTASGNIIKGVETEAPVQSETQTEAQTDENGNVIETPHTDANGNVVEGTPQTDENGVIIGYDYSQSANGALDGTGGSESYTSDAGNSGGTDDYSGGSSSNGDGSYNGDDYYSGETIVIEDPGNGDYSYSDGSGSGGSSGGSSDGSSGGSGTSTPSDVIIQGISSRYIDESELYNYSAGQLRLIRNEIFALHGRIFNSQDLADYFSQKSWYVPTYNPEDFDANMFSYLNDYEEANLKVIMNYEAALANN